MNLDWMINMIMLAFCSIQDIKEKEVSLWKLKIYGFLSLAVCLWDILDQMGILDKAFVRADQLSGGQQQRVALARTLAQNPQVILADEPVASLDPVTAKQVMDDFQRINRDMHITVLINIHHVELALQYATRVSGIRAGEIVYDGPANQVDQAVLDSIYQGKQEEPA